MFEIIENALLPAEIIKNGLIVGFGNEYFMGECVKCGFTDSIRKETVKEKYAKD